VIAAATDYGHDIGHLVHIRMLTDRFDESLAFVARVYDLKL
jgi:hypothetical protein|tara:strand:- start:33105 stop:33227 length:123 start_codon:yes stop_codon:yes gene_type:complete